MLSGANGREKPTALALLSSERPRNVGWLQAAGLLFGDWGTSRLYVLGLAFFFASRSSFYLIAAMSLLIMAVAWAYTQICRIYPDGGGVYTAAKHRSRTLAVIGALLLFADYTVTASLSSLDAFHYFGLPLHRDVEQTGPRVPPNVSDFTEAPDAGDTLDVHREQPPSISEGLFAADSPGLWAIVAIAAIGLFNLMGPKHTGGFALITALAMVAITLLITVGAVPQIDFKQLPHRIGHLNHSLSGLWIAFISIVLALSGVEAIANLTGVMKKPVAHTARKAIWTVAIEVAVFNIILAVCMLAIVPPVNRDTHMGDMLAFLTQRYIGPWGAWNVRIIGGLLLLSATNTALTDMISVQYLMARDGELPVFMQALNRFGVPWVPALVAASAPIVVLLFVHQLDSLAALYAIGVIGAVAINVTLCALHPRLRRMRRKTPMMLLGIFLLAIWVTLAYVKLHALLFVAIVMAVGLSARQLNRWLAARRPKPSLLRQAIIEQLPPEALAKPKLMIGTYGSENLAPIALAIAKSEDLALVVCFIRELTLSYKYEGRRLSLDTDVAAQRTFARFLELGHEAGVPIIPVYDVGSDAAIVLAEAAAIYGATRILIGTSRRGVIYHLVKGHFQRRLEALLPPEIPVEVIAVTPEPPPKSRAAARASPANP
jgi:amino acid transporter